MITKIPASEISSSAIAFLIVGPAGSGKSKLAADMAELGKTLILYTDNKAGKSTYSSMRSKNYRNIELWEFVDIDTSAIDATREFNEAINELLMIPKDEFPYKFIWLDSLTSYGEIVLKWSTISNAMTGAGGSHKFASIGMPCPNIADYGTQLNQIRYVINRLIMLPCTVGVLAHEKDVYNKDGYLVDRVIDVTGKTSYSRNLASKFSEIYRSYQVMDTSGNNRLEMITVGNDIYSWCASKGLGVPSIINGFEDLKPFLKERI